MSSADLPFDMPLYILEGAGIWPAYPGAATCLLEGSDAGGVVRGVGVETEAFLEDLPEPAEPPVETAMGGG